MENGLNNKITKPIIMVSNETLASEISLFNTKDIDKCLYSEIYTFFDISKCIFEYVEQANIPERS